MGLTRCYKTEVFFTFINLIHAHDAVQFRLETFGCKIHIGVLRGCSWCTCTPGREKNWGLNL